MSGGRIARIEPGSPAERAGLEVGMELVSANGVALLDRIDWVWYSDGDRVEVEVADAHGNPLYGEIVREAGEPWGIGFEDELFDGMHLCRNNCTFCFMRMLPQGMRSSLYLRDDDYRLSFTQGNFITLTNVTDEEIDRIVEQQMTPLHVSFHALTPSVRASIMGGNEHRGVEVFERLMGEGVGVFVQIVLIPGVNDGLELERTLGYLLGFGSVLGCGIVPLGFTRHQDRFHASFEEPADASRVIEQVERVCRTDPLHPQRPRVLLADAFYLYAGRSVPGTGTYGAFEMFEDGIGMVRWAIDDFEALAEEHAHQTPLQAAGKVVTLTGRAFAPILAKLVGLPPFAGRVDVLAVDNAFFGGNVDVTGLLTGVDLARAIRDHMPGERDMRFLVPDCVFNADGLTLDDYTIGDIIDESGRIVDVVCCNAMGLLEALSV